MISTEEQIASRLVQAFNTHGFAKHSVAELQKQHVGKIVLTV
jgi:DNA-directed RNA polymerase specialized sigma54-like protein